MHADQAAGQHQIFTRAYLCAHFACRPGKDLPGIQDAVLRTAERILGDENPDDGSIKLPHKCQLRMLLYKHQIGMIMGKRGSTINEMRNKSSATIKLVSPHDGIPVAPCAFPDDEIITVSQQDFAAHHTLLTNAAVHLLCPPQLTPAGPVPACAVVGNSVLCNHTTVRQLLRCTANGTTEWLILCLLSCCLQIAGTPDQTLTALKMITDKLRTVTAAPDADRGMHDYGRDRDSPVDKRSRGEGPPPGTA